jgi:hypothetical protein
LWKRTAESRDLEHSERGERHRDALKAAREAVHQIEEALDWLEMAGPRRL